MTVRQGDLRQEAERCSDFRWPNGDSHLIPELQSATSPPIADHHDRRIRFRAPVFDLSVFTFHIVFQVYVRILPLEFRDRPCQRDRAGQVIRYAGTMMCEDRDADRKETCGSEQKFCKSPCHVMPPGPLYYCQLLINLKLVQYIGFNGPSRSSTNFTSVNRFFAPNVIS